MLEWRVQQVGNFVDFTRYVSPGPRAGSDNVYWMKEWADYFCPKRVYLSSSPKHPVNPSVSFVPGSCWANIHTPQPLPTSPVPSTASVSCPDALWKAGKGRKRKAQAFPSLGTSFAFLSLPTGRCCGLGCIQALIWHNLSGSIWRVTIPSGIFPLWLAGDCFLNPLPSVEN